MIPWIKDLILNYLEAIIILIEISDYENNEFTKK